MKLHCYHFISCTLRAKSKHTYIPAEILSSILANYIYLLQDPKTNLAKLGKHYCYHDHDMIQLYL